MSFCRGGGVVYPARCNWVQGTCRPPYRGPAVPDPQLHLGASDAEAHMLGTCRQKHKEMGFFPQGKMSKTPCDAACLYSSSSCIDRKKQKFRQRRLRGAHVPASDSIAQSFDKEQELEILDHIVFPTTRKCPATYSALLRRCGKRMSGMLLHHHIIKDGFEHFGILQNLLVKMYNQCYLMYDASCLSNRMPFRDEFAWNFMISACSRDGKITETTRMFDRMLGEGIAPNKFTYTSVLLAYASHEVLAQGKRLHAQLIGSDLDALLGNALAGMYCKCGELNDAKQLFDMLSERDVVSWATMVAAHSKQGQGEEALYFFKQMQQAGVIPNMATFVSVLDACANEHVILEGQCLHACFAGSVLESSLIFGTALLNLYGKHGNVRQAREIFDKMPERSMVSWNSLITAYLLHSRTKDVLALFDQMLQEGGMPDKFIYVGVFSAHATKEDLTDGKRMYSRLFSSNFRLDTVVLTAVLNMFCKCGSMKDAEEAFDNTQDPDDVLWTSMISGYAQHGQGKNALQLFKRMQHEGPPPNQVTYTSVLSACSREGLVDEGVRHLLSMDRDHGIKPNVDHCNCVIDLLARCGQLDRAEGLITSSGATCVSWTSLLDACRKHLDLDRGKRAARRMLELDANASSPYILLSNITATG